LELIAAITADLLLVVFATGADTTGAATTG